MGDHDQPENQLKRPFAGLVPQPLLGDQGARPTTQQLDQMQADAVSYADDTASDAGADQRKRVDRAQWQEIPTFHYTPQPPDGVLRSLLWPLLSLLGWALGGALLMGGSIRRLGGVR